jgi:hypothetical protein
MQPNNRKEKQMSDQKQPQLHAYTVTKSGEKSYFHRIGAAWANTKGGYLLRLHALPVNGEVVLFPPKEDVSDTDA